MSGPVPNRVPIVFPLTFILQYVHVINQHCIYVTNQQLEEILKIAPAGFKPWLWVLLMFALNPDHSLVRLHGTRSSEGERYFKTDPDCKSIGLTF